MGIMSVDEPAWEYHHHRSSFLPNSNLVESDLASFISFNVVKNTQSLVFMQGVDSEGNMCNVTQTIPIDISMKHGVVKHIHIGQNCSTSEIEIYMSLFKEFEDFFSWSYE